MAMHLAQRLEKAGIKVTIMGLLDAAAGWESENVDHTISDNVGIARNYYQLSSDNTVQSFGGPARRKEVVLGLLVILRLRLIMKKWTMSMDKPS